MIAWIGEHEIKAPLTGMVRGLLNDGLAVVGGFKIGDIDPRGETADFTSVSDKARAIGGGVLEALMMLMHQSDKRSAGSGLNENGRMVLPIRPLNY